MPLRGSRMAIVMPMLACMHSVIIHAVSAELLQASRTPLGDTPQPASCQSYCCCWQPCLHSLQRTNRTAPAGLTPQHLLACHGPVLSAPDCQPFDGSHTMLWVCCEHDDRLVTAHACMMKLYKEGSVAVWVHNVAVPTPPQPANLLVARITLHLCVHWDPCFLELRAR
jgi:hypothetical protein